MKPDRLRAEIETFFYDYADAIDQDRIEEWPEFFVEHGVYKIVSRENFDRGLPLATMLCESKGMMKDRVNAIRNLSMFAPRYLRHLIANVRVKAETAQGIAVHSNYAVMQTLMDGETRVFNAGRCVDEIVREGDFLKFKSRFCIYDTIVIPNSLIYPL
jgi:3-phenylpropionate/cinnamic acid dioxygenase small subunit